MKFQQPLWVLETPEDNCLKMHEGVWVEFFIQSEACLDHMYQDWHPLDEFNWTDSCERCQRGVVKIKRFALWLLYRDLSALIWDFEDELIKVKMIKDLGTCMLVCVCDKVMYYGFNICQELGVNIPTDVI